MPAVKERPILFSAPMVRAILDGRKTQTRRAVKERNFPADFHARCPAVGVAAALAERAADVPSWCPYGAPGDRLWVRETFYQRPHYVGNESGEGDLRWTGLKYAADVTSGLAEQGVKGWVKRPSIFMRRADSRIDLEVTAIRVERLHDITEEDARAEGVERTHAGEWTYGGRSVTGRPWAHSFFILWNEINGRESWDLNPWVWVVTFKRVRP